jgi:hypothetical protein
MDVDDVVIPKAWSTTSTRSDRRSCTCARSATTSSSPTQQEMSWSPSPSARSCATVAVPTTRLPNCESEPWPEPGLVPVTHTIGDESVIVGFGCRGEQTQFAESFRCDEFFSGVPGGRRGCRSTGLASASASARASARASASIAPFISWAFERARPS